MPSNANLLRPIGVPIDVEQRRLSTYLTKTNGLQPTPRTTLDSVTIHVCTSDGQQIGEFGEEYFRQNLFANRFAADAFYWHEGMADWAPISNYRALAKTQRISFVPPMRRTVRIDMDAESKAQTQSKPESAIGRFWKKLTGRGNS